MKIKRRTKINKPLVAIAIIVFIGILIFLGYLFVYKPHNDAISPTTSQESTSDKKQSADLKNSSDDKDIAPNADKPATPNTDSTSSKKQVQMTASTDASGDTIFIRGGINYPLTDGSCYAQLSGPSGQSIRKDTTLLPNPASADCKTISIPISELVPGTWSFTLRYISTDYEGISNEISFSV